MKKFLAATLAFITIFSIVGCSSTCDSDSSSETKSSVSVVSGVSSSEASSNNEDSSNNKGSSNNNESSSESSSADDSSTIDSSNLKTNSYTAEDVSKALTEATKNKEMVINASSGTNNFNTTFSDQYIIMESNGTWVEYYFVNNKCYMAMYMYKDSLINELKNTTANSEIDYKSMSDDDLIKYIQDNTKSDTDISVYEDKFILFNGKLPLDKSSNDVKKSITSLTDSIGLDKDFSVKVLDKAEEFDGVACDVVECIPSIPATDSSSKSDSSSLESASSDSKYYIYFDNNSKEIVGMKVSNKDTNGVIKFNKAKRLAGVSDLPEYLKNAKELDPEHALIGPMAIFSSLVSDNSNSSSSVDKVDTDSNSSSSEAK